MSPIKPPIPVAIPLFIGIIAISFSSIFVKMSEAPVSVQAMYRLLITILLMLPFGVKYRKEMKLLTRKDLWLLLASGFMLAMHFLLWMGSLTWTSVASSTIILSLQPVFVMMGAFFLFKEKTTISAISGMGIAFLGVFLLIGKGGAGETGTHLTGDLMSLFGTAAIAVHMLLGQMILRKISSYLYSLFVFAAAAAVLAVYNTILGFPVTGYPAGEWGIFALLAIVPTVFGHLLFNSLMRFTSASTVSMSVLGEPVGASLLAFLILHETMTALQAAGGLLVLLGLVLFLNTRSSRKTASEMPTESY